MDQSKEKERAELHKTIWNIANDLRGSIDGWEFKNYVLGFLFYRFLSENITNHINEHEGESFDYALLTDEEADIAKESLIDTKGIFIYPSQLFENVRKRAKDDEDLNITLQNIFKDIEATSKGRESQENFSGLFSDIDLNSNRLGNSVVERNEKILKLMNAIGDMNLSVDKETSIDTIGDTYEFLLGMYASQAGKSGGEYYTPQEVSELLTLLALNGKKQISKIYDPACGSGSLLLKASKILGPDNVTDGFYGQEINLSTYNLCRINMLLHDVEFDKFSIANGDTLTNPQHWDDEPFEVIVSNPPYSLKWDGKDSPVLVNDERFSVAGALAPKTKADLAFIMHSLAWLSNDGTAAIVCFPGILYRGGAEQKIRKYLVDNNFIDAVIQLPSNLFFGTGIATSILVLKKMKSDDKVLFVDASKYFIKSGNKNKLTEEDIKKIVEIFSERKDIEYISEPVSKEKIAEEDYNLSVSIYVEPEDTSEKIDIEAVNKEIEKLIQKENELRDKIVQFVKKI